MIRYYPLLIESAIEFKIEARRILSERDSKCSSLDFSPPASVVLTRLVPSTGDFPMATESVDKCAIASGFKIVNHDNKYYCLRDG